MKTIEIRIPEQSEVSYRIECLEEHLPVIGNAIDSGDKEYDNEVETAILEDLEHNEWAWCCVRVVASWRGIEGDDYLGACSYSSEEEFMKEGYYEDMKERAYEDLIDQLQSLK